MEVILLKIRISPNIRSIHRSPLLLSNPAVCTLPVPKSWVLNPGLLLKVALSHSLRGTCLAREEQVGTYLMSEPGWAPQMCISMCICLAGFTWASAETSVTENRPGLPTPPRCTSTRVDDTACWKCVVTTAVLPPSFSSSSLSASSQGLTFNSHPCPMR